MDSYLKINKIYDGYLEENKTFLFREEKGNDRMFVTIISKELPYLLYKNTEF